ncbi:MAG: ribonuclease III [bacterium]|nr:ribonuclease III [bacterium]
MNDEFVQILNNLRLKPNNLSFYRTAFTHRSFLNEAKEVKESNERLEFLGDAILSFITSGFLFHKRAHDAEGDLTNLRSYIVKTESLARVSQKLSLGKFLRMSKGEEFSGGRQNPQILANTYEALLGAIFMDLGIEAAQTFIYQTLLPLFATEITKGAPRDPKSELQEMVQEKFQVSPKYKIIGTIGPDHAKKFTVGVFVKDELLGRGSGSSKQQAEEDSAKEALKKLTEHLT